MSLLTKGTGTMCAYIQNPPPSNILPLILLTLSLPPLLLLTHHIRKDYHAFLALGPGGTPSTPTGYLRISLLRLIALRNPLTPPPIPSTLHNPNGLLHTSLHTLPTRPSPRPLISGIAPQRQLTHNNTNTMRRALTSALHTLAKHNHSTLYTATSSFEKHSTALFIHPLQPNPSTTTTNPSNGKEICHAHPSDGSLHLTLHPADVATAIERGWAQRHPLARDDDTGWLGGLLGRCVPTGFVMVYAPRDGHELRCVLEIVRAAAWWVSGDGMGGGGTVVDVGWVGGVGGVDGLGWTEGMGMGS
ncbi:hypothetical protein P168DRAFT_323799 [Aspergillus campestris IBT 28561]|uniref:Luciferase domain-containing protein n=1 Tax=Aspergillus campestris (strain IBT 28561) TaxID=1392248 RepID=A0A2I1DFS2_ASPC2|nr:uncharacterized protein P168DRAFT_323799 [Aspergillus campestris IBT 28561]PKY08725.1 hypothetical protein P168DRAFT_323799 [Aspergillus campestris IBT 28561]